MIDTTTPPELEAVAGGLDPEQEIRARALELAIMWVGRYWVGLCYASVCTSLTDTDATTRLNADRPSGTENGWTIADEPFKDGTPNGSACETVPTRRHLLFAC